MNYLKMNDVNYINATNALEVMRYLITIADREKYWFAEFTEYTNDYTITIYFKEDMNPIFITSELERIINKNALREICKEEQITVKYKWIK